MELCIPRAQSCENMQAEVTAFRQFASRACPKQTASVGPAILDRCKP
jgi:hypothetical protein